MVLILAKNDIEGITPRIQEMCRYSSVQVIKARSRVTIGAEHTARFENNHAIATGHENRAIEIDTFDRVIETNLNHGACVNCDLWLLRSEA